MKALPKFLALAMIAIVVSAFGASPPSSAPRLSEVPKFPKAYAAAVHAVIAAITKEGMKASEYYVEISEREAVLHFWLIHEIHDPDPSWMGDSCGRCRTIDYDPRTGTVSKIRGIR
jgi:hypothetical protein